MNLDKENISKKFLELESKYHKLGENVQQALEMLFEDSDISYLSIQFRVKELKSFLDKIKRKEYKDPFNEIEDICGLRVICYYQSDIKRIEDIISKEFLIKENQNKDKLLKINEFGYRSTHLIAKIKEEWTNSLNYSHLRELKFEVQIRTILMHSWAEIEHKLSYKSETHIPENLKRKFSFISAKLEESDTQFEEIKNAIELNKKNLIENAKKDNKFDPTTELNLDTLQIFMDFAFPDRQSDLDDTSDLLDDMHLYKITFSELIEGFEKYKDILPKIETEISVSRNYKPQNGLLWFQVGAVRTIFELINDEYFEYMYDDSDSDSYVDVDIIEKWRNKK